MIASLFEEGGSRKTRLNLETNQIALSVHLDYLRVYVKLSSHELLTDVCNYCIGTSYITESITWSPFGGHYKYDNKITSPLGVLGGWFICPDTGLYNLCLDFSGTFFETKSNVDTWRMIVGLYYVYKARCTRIDLAIDDYSYEIIPVNDMVKETLNGNTFGFRNYKFIISGNNTDRKVADISQVSGIVHTQMFNISGMEFISKANATIYFGSRNSGKMVRIYDHESECLRFETEYKRGYAPQVFEAIATFQRGDDFALDSVTHKFERRSSGCIDASVIERVNCMDANGTHEQNLSRFLGGVAVSAIDFRNKDKVKNRRKASVRDTDRFYWWDEFIDNIGSYMKIRLPKKNVKTIEKTLAWINKQVAPSLAMLKLAMGGWAFEPCIESVLEQGEKRLTTYQKYIIDMYQSIGFST